MIMKTTDHASPFHHDWINPVTIMYRTPNTYAMRLASVNTLVSSVKHVGWGERSEPQRLCSHPPPYSLPPSSTVKTYVLPSIVSRQNFIVSSSGYCLLGFAWLTSTYGLLKLSIESGPKTSARNHSFAISRLRFIFIYFFLVKPLQQEISFTTMPIKNGRKIKMADQIIGKENT